MRYVLDTNVVIGLLRKKQEVIRRVRRVRVENLLIPSVVHYELRVGVGKSTDPVLRQRKEDALQLLLSDVEVLNFGLKEAGIAAAIRTDLERKGTPIGGNDILIAACALAADAVLVSANTKEFARVNELVLQDWSAA